MLCSPLMESAGGSTNDPIEHPINNEQRAREERPTCPKCGSQDVRRSHDEGVLAALLRMLGRWPFRCRSCRSRFYRSAPPAEDA